MPHYPKLPKNYITILAGPEPHNMLSSITERKSYLLSAVIGLSNNLIKWEALVEPFLSSKPYVLLRLMMRRCKMVKDRESEPTPLATGPLKLLQPPHPMHHQSEKWELQRAMIIKRVVWNSLSPILTSLPSALSSATSEFFLSNSVAIPTSCFSDHAVLYATTRVWASSVVRRLNLLAPRILYYIGQKHLAGTSSLTSIHEVYT